MAEELSKMTSHPLEESMRSSGEQASGSSIWQVLSVERS